MSDNETYEQTIHRHYKEAITARCESNVLAVMLLTTYDYSRPNINQQILAAAAASPHSTTLAAHATEVRARATPPVTQD